MDLFVGRQPILDRFQRTYGYELLFRNGTENIFNSLDDDQASLSVIDTSIGQMGIQRITGGRKAFINFTRRRLLEDYGNLLPRDSVVIESLEMIEPDAEVTAACHRLKQAGYTLALDDFQYATQYDQLLETIRIIKVDLSVTDSQEQLRLAKQFLPLNIELLAERVETTEDFRQTREMGYSYFQGYFFQPAGGADNEKTAGVEDCQDAAASGSQPAGIRFFPCRGNHQTRSNLDNEAVPLYKLGGFRPAPGSQKHQAGLRVS